MKLKYYLLYGVIYALVAGTICMEQKKKLLSRNTVKHGQRKNQLFFWSVCMLSDGKNQSLIFHDEENCGRLDEN